MFVAICKHLPVASSCLHGLAPWIQPVWSLSFEVQPYGHAKWSNRSWCIRAQCPTWKKPSFLQCKNLSADHWSDACSIMLHGNKLEQCHVNIPLHQVSKDFLMVVCERADEVWELSKDMTDGVSLYALYTSWWPSWPQEMIWNSVKKQPNPKHVMSPDVV